MNNQILRTLFEEIYRCSVEAPGKMKRIEELTQTLNAVVNREKPWTPGYLYNLLTDKPNFRITPELEQAINIIITRRDDAHPLLARMVKVEHVYSVNGNLKPGDFISGHRRQCACLVWFVPHHPRQKYCCLECPQRAKKIKVNQQGEINQ